PIGFASRPAPIPVYGWDLPEELSTSCPWQAFQTRRGRDKPGRQGKAGLRHEGKPGWFSLIGRSASPMGLLPFRYTVGTYLQSFPQAALGRRFRPRRGRDEPGRQSKAGLSYQGKPGWFSLIGRSASPMGLLPFRYTVGTCLKSFPQAALGRRFRPRRGRDKPGRRSRAGLRHEGKPRWFSLIGRSASPMGLLPFRYTVGTCLKSFPQAALGRRFRPRRGRDEPGRQSRAGLRHEGKPRWFSLIGRSASPMGLLPFRYTVGTYLKSFPQAALGRHSSSADRLRRHLPENGEESVP